MCRRECGGQQQQQKKSKKRKENLFQVSNCRKTGQMCQYNMTGDPQSAYLGFIYKFADRSYSMACIAFLSLSLYLPRDSVYQGPFRPRLVCTLALAVTRFQIKFRWETNQPHSFSIAASTRCSLLKTKEIKIQLLSSFLRIWIHVYIFTLFQCHSSS